MENKLNELLELLKGVELCNIETGQYFKAVSFTIESTGPTVLLEPID